MSDAPDLRVSDQERERAAEEIRDHFAAGRLDEDELNERVSAAYAAKTNGELAALRADLPALPASPAQHRAELAQRRHGLARHLIQQSAAGMSLFVLCAVIWLVDGANGQFWPVWVLLLVLLPLLRNGWRLYGPAPELDRVERHLQRRERHDGGRRDNRDQRRDERRRRHHRGGPGRGRQ